MRTLTPREIVTELDRYIVSQQAAKRAVAIALRNRWRRQQVEGELRDEIQPKNILMIGPTGVGKTEIARRVARLAQAPFIKVEASKFTEVGYVGRDVESIIRDLTELAVKMVREEEAEKVREPAARVAEERLLDALYPRPGDVPPPDPDPTRERLRQKLRAGELDESEVEIETAERSMPTLEIVSPQGIEELGFSLRDLMGNLMPRKTRQRRMTVAQARELLRDEEAQRMIDPDSTREVAIQRVEQTGIVFLDEIDKIARHDAPGADVSREGVQRDLLPIIEGCAVQTKHGTVRSDHVLFIAAGAFHVSRPSDLIPELQGRFPIRVELEDLDEAAFVRILEEPHNALAKQYQALLKTEGVTLEFKPDAIREIARIAAEVNRMTENIGARRLHTVLERLLDDVLFGASEMDGETVVFDGEKVRASLAEIASDRDLSRYVL
ncbi:MAG: ATP-dependent protease ATPase subunit HslU [Myxococcales bacterium]|nr:ATP-dependent protease ATPase subunit HslU [Myxococcales bacterium]MCZ6822951.1 ATP-dependent protease ATPase subunit HslU [Deltaproteobacteria bacterium]TDI97662.1 MAG: ATP-dependent protease ATPase subunit HslU [Deltaproteobacteria bacterium]TDJ09058.1 MAG: ATP-dependent protease ATPase subunit HslU [Deltaproteobacteria bacterium]